ncbi:MAG TPA: winged helix-turn-helix transcriptional regulator [Chthoniobacterales bacterium]|nr:winged helix-turn-helix transcriptional regulator [Chthoniobacterales bacterium]
MRPSHQPTLWRTCRVLANRKRLQIFALAIRRPGQTVSAAAEHLKLSLPAASQYLRALEARGLLTCRRVGRRVEYRPPSATADDPAREIVTALRLVFRRKAKPVETLFRMATAFTHPRRLDVFRAVKNGADSFDKVQAVTGISRRALLRHLSKLEARDFVKSEIGVYTIANQANPFGRVLAHLALK